MFMLRLEPRAVQKAEGSEREDAKGERGGEKARVEIESQVKNASKQQT